jgi:hypothetical protein
MINFMRKDIPRAVLIIMDKFYAQGRLLSCANYYG